MVNPFEEFGNNAEPPGNVIVKVPFGTTESGRMKPTVTSWACVTGCPFTIAVHCTWGKT